MKLVLIGAILAAVALTGLHTTQPAQTWQGPEPGSNIFMGETALHMIEPVQSQQGPKLQSNIVDTIKTVSAEVREYGNVGWPQRQYSQLVTPGVALWREYFSAKSLTIASNSDDLRRAKTKPGGENTLGT